MLVCVGEKKELFKRERKRFLSKSFHNESHSWLVCAGWLAGWLTGDRMEYNRFKKVIINSSVPEVGVVTGDSLEEAAPFI